MRKLSLLLLVLMMAFSVVLTACGGGDDKNADEPEGTTETNEGSNEDATEPEEPVKELEGELTFWVWDTAMFEEAVAAFQAKYPKVKVNMVAMEFHEMHDKTLTAIAAGSGGPDVVIIEGQHFKRFTTIEGLEDLLQPPYNAGEFKGDFTEANWQKWMSLDGKRLIGMPWDMPPAVTIYRADILEENGFPSDPAELQEFMKDPENVLNMARTLKQKDIYIFEWRDQPVGLMNSGVTFFDFDLNFVRNTDGFAKGLDIAKQVAQEGLYLNQGIWSEEGQQAIKNGKLAFVYLGSWGTGTVKNWAGEEQAGKWRVTGLPFGAYGGMGGSTLSILSQSKNKELAWEFIKWNLVTPEGQLVWTKRGTVPGWKPAWDFPEFKDATDPYYGDQNLNLLYASLLDKVPPAVNTPLDDKANELWGQMVNEVLDKNLDSKAALQKVEEDIMNAVANDRQKLLDARK